MKVKAVRTFLVDPQSHKHWLFVKVEADNTEYFVNFEEMGREIARPPFSVEQSYVALPTTPGLGIDLDEDALARHPYREAPLRRVRRPHEE